MKRAALPPLCFTLLAIVALQPAHAKQITGDGLLSLLPRDAVGVFYLDVQKAMTTPMAQKAVAEGEDDFNEFLDETGIDPKKDVYAIAGVLSEATMGKDHEGVVVVNLEYKRDTLLGLAREKGNVKTSEYEGITIVEMSEDDDDSEDPTFAAFLDNSTIAFGAEDEVLGAVDVFKKKAENVLDNEKLTALLPDVNRASILWAAFVIPPEATADLSEENPMLGGIKDLRSLVANLDYADAMVMAELIARSDNATTTKQLAEFLRGMKAFGGMMTADEPEWAGVLDSIKITETADRVSLKASIPEKIFLEHEKKMDDSEEVGEGEDEDGGW